MALPRAFKTDESFLEKIAIGVTGTRQVFHDLQGQGHEPIELERGSQSFKIWKVIKIKRVRVPDILCLRCGRRVESRAKTRMEITLSHSLSDPERGWDFGLADEDRFALVYCQRTGPGPLDWRASPLVQYLPVAPLRQTWAEGRVKTERPKGAQEGFERRVTWPAAVAASSGIVEFVGPDFIRYRRDEGSPGARSTMVRLNRPGGTLRPLVQPGERIQPGQIVAAIVPVSGDFSCPGGTSVVDFIGLSHSVSPTDRYTAVKALGHFPEESATAALALRVADEQEHIYVRLDGAAGLMRRWNRLGRQFFETTLHDAYLANRLEAVIVLAEVGTPEAIDMLVRVLRDSAQHAEIRAGAAWSLGEIRAPASLSALVESFASLDLVVQIEAARALAKLAREHLPEVLRTFPESSMEQMPGVAWALSKAGGFTVGQILDVLPTEVSNDARQWLAYIIGAQDPGRMLPEIDALSSRDPEVYFAVTVLWKIMASWVYGLEEY